MKVDATDAAIEIIEKVKRDRSGDLVITIGTGCCESTAPFLYEDFWPGPDHEQVGEAAGVPIYAPEYLRSLYPGDDSLVVDVNADGLGDSLSIEIDYDCRFTLRLPGEARGAPETCATTTVPRNVVGELPAGLRNVKLR